MDFLHGFAKAARLDFFKIGNGDWDTDYVTKGEKLVGLFGSPAKRVASDKVNCSTFLSKY